MIKTSNAVFAVVMTMIFSSIINYPNPLGLALKVGLFQMIGGVIGIGFLLLLQERKQRQFPRQEPMTNNK